MVRLGPTATQGELVADIERSAQEAVLMGRRKRNPCVEKGGVSLPSKRATARPHHDWYRVNRGSGSVRREALQPTDRIRAQRSDSLRVTRSKAWGRNLPGPHH